MLKCKACGGTYNPVLSDGQQYFHVCPPLSAPELVAAVNAGKVALPIGKTVDDLLATTTYERANKRDENVPPPGSPLAGAGMKAAGAGVQTIAAPAPAVVVVS